MESNQGTVGEKSGDYFRKLTILHSALLVSAILITFIFYYLGGDPQEEESVQMYTTIGIVVAFAAVFASAYWYKSKSLSLQKSEDLSEKLSEYRAVSQKTWMIMEVGIVINVILYFMGGGELLLYIALFLIVMFFLKRPSRQRCIDSLALNKAEQTKITDLNAVIID